MNVRSLVCCASGVLAACVCAGRVQAAVPYGFTTSLVVRADQQWTDTGIDLPLHSTVDTKATGVVQADGRLFEGHKRFDARVGPMGTVNYKDDEEHAFPIPVGMPTRAPAYALIGRIDGEGGTPFVLGQFAQTVSAGGGRLWLGINDYDVKDNEGTWRVELTVQTTKGVPAHAAPAAPAAPVAARQPAAPDARPVPAVNAVWSTSDTIRAAAGMLTDVIAVEDAVTNGVSGTNSIPVVIAEQVRQQTNLINVELAQFPSITNTTRVEIDMSGATNVVMEFAFETNFPSAPQIKIVSTKKQAERGEEQEVYIYLDRVSLSDLQPSDTNTPLLSDYIGVNDPLETFNRAMFKTEEKIYVYFLGPVGKGYAYVVPLHVRKGIERMDDNIVMPVRLVNCLLQAKFKGAGVEFTRFLVNTTVGLAGFYDPAKAWMGLEEYDEDFGQTFATWGIGPGCYIYLPLYGTGTLRDDVGSVFDSALDPRTYAPFGSYVKVFMKFNNMTMRIDDYERLQRENLDPYVVMRDMWYLMQTAKIAD